MSVFIGANQSNSFTLGKSILAISLQTRIVIAEQF